ncbi:MAG: hypothetical protein EOP88_08395 [Verrucomicrobiaceae bacterium]|nr:MAG: hypothetical protein EOP88_08395 [Verrucomicrobiaceae bacterium]
MKMALPRVVVFLSLAMLPATWLETPLHAEETKEERQGVKISPSNAFVCSIESGQGGYGNVVTLKALSGSRSVEIHRSDRWVEASWSPDSRWLLVTDHWDGHGANIRVYEVSGNHAAAEWKVREVYATPGPTQYDCKWSLVEWKPENGSVRLKCDYLSLPDGVVDAKAARVSKTWEIPLDYP